MRWNNFLEDVSVLVKAVGGGSIAGALMWKGDPQAQTECQEKSEGHRDASGPASE